MTETLPVHVNRSELHGLDVPNAVEVTGPFDVVLQNHGESVHVHLHLDDALSEVASLEANNHHVESESMRRVHVDVKGTGPIRGKLKVVTAYGATTRYVDVVLEQPPEEKQEVTVDESLSRPQPQETPAQNRPTQSSGLGLAERPELLVLVLGGLALVIALIAAVVLDNTAVLLGSLAVLAGVLVAIYLLVE
ncbi:MAG: hypothetical protein V5A34_04220 [Halapricum sp.]